MKRIRPTLLSSSLFGIWQVVFYGFFLHCMIRIIFSQQIYDWFVGGRMSYLRYLSLLTHSGVQHISCCCLSLFCVLCAQCCHFLWIVHSWLPLRFSLTFICITLKHGRESRQVHFFYLFLKPRLMHFLKISDNVIIYSI